MFKGISIFFCAAVMVISLASPVQAAENTGSIAIKLDAGELAVTQGSVTICHAGTITEGGYQLDDNFGGGFVRKEDARSVELVQWLIRMDQSPSGISQELDADGWASVSGLPDGLYLLVQEERMEGFYPFQPFLVELSEEAGRNIQLNPLVYPIVLELPATGQGAQVFWAMVGMAGSGLGILICFFCKRFRKMWN